MNTEDLTISDLSFQWPGAPVPIFAGLSYSFLRGSVTAIMAANGTGKTTFLEILARRHSSAAAKVMLNQTPAVAGDFNYLPQHSERVLFGHLTLDENIALRRLRTPELAGSALGALFPDPRVLSRYPSQCSGGQRQRAVLARALLDVSEFPVTLLDESFSQLSRDAKQIVGPALQIAARSADAVLVFVTHDLCDAMCNSDNVAVLAPTALYRFDTQDIRSETDFWQRRELRDSILGSLSRTEVTNR